MSGTNFTRGANWTTTNGGSIVVNNSGLFTSTAAGTIVSNGSFTQSGLGAVSISGSVSTNNALISLAGPVTLAGNMAFNSGVTSGPITFLNTVDGDHTLTLTSGLANILFQSAVGSSTPLNDVVVANANNVTFNGLSATSFNQLTGTGTTTLNGTTDTSAVNGIQIVNNGITLNGTVTTAAAGPVELTNGGLLTLTATINAAGAFTQNGLGSTLLSGSVTSGGPLFFKEGVAVSGNGFLTTSNQLITLSSTLNGPGNLTLDSGSGNTIFASTAGATTPLGALTFTNGNNITTNSINALSITQVAGAGTTSIIGNINTSGVAGINLTGTAFVLDGSVITLAGGPLFINHTAASSFVFGPATLLSGPFTETGTGNISLAGILHANDSNITFTNPITMTAATTLNSDGGGDILISNTMNGNVDLNLIAGTGDITINAVMGGITPIHSVVIQSVNNVTTEAISAGFLTQTSGTGLSDFGGALATTTSTGINVSGNQFTFGGPVTTTGNGPATITNVGLLTIPTGSPFNLTGAFSQLGTGPVTLCDSITTTGGQILFTGPVFLCNSVDLDTGITLGNITFLNAVTGSQNLNLAAGFGDITFAQNIGPLNILNVTSAANLTSQSLSAASIDLSGVSTLATINGTLMTSGAAGITLSGSAFTLNGGVTTTGSGPLTITNSGLLTLLPNAVFTLDGPLVQNGSGGILGGGMIDTNNQTVLFQSPFTLTGNLDINTGTPGANVTVGEVNGPYNLSIEAGVGNVTATEVIGGITALKNVTVTTSNDINLNGIGSTTDGVTGALTLNATDNINLNNGFYSANNQTYSAGNLINFNNGALVTVTSFGTPITFASGTVHLSSGNDLSVVTNNGNFSFGNLTGTTFENIMINAGTGNVALGSISSAGTINNLFVNGGNITFAGPINAVNTDFVSLTNISNLGAQVLIESTNTASFNALGGNVGSAANPILVHTSNQIFAGAGGPAPSLAAFDGVSADNTVHPIPSDPPCIIIFNGVTIANCGAPPVPPVPPKPPIPPSPKVIRFPFADPGFNSSFFNLASDYYFFPDFIDQSYFYDCIFLEYCPPETCCSRCD